MKYPFQDDKTAPIPYDRDSLGIYILYRICYASGPRDLVLFLHAKMEEI